MSDICGFGGFAIVDGARGPDQSFRFFVPIFLHAGIVHLLVNLAVQCFGSTAQVSPSGEKIPLLPPRRSLVVECFNIQVERMMGTPKFILLYLAAGIFGFVLGSNFALVGQPSVGASGAIFGTHAALLLCVAFFFHRRFPRKRDTDVKGSKSLATSPHTGRSRINRNANCFGS